MQPQGIDLSGLKDIHLPALPSLWPLPVAFWLCVAGVVALVVLSVFALKFAKRLTARKYAVREIDSLKRKYAGDGYRQVVEASLLMRRIAMMKYPDAGIPALTGKAWRAFLEKTVKKPVFKGVAGDVAENVMFIPAQKFDDTQTEQVLAAVCEWIVENT